MGHFMKLAPDKHEAGDYKYLVSHQEHPYDQAPSAQEHQGRPDATGGGEPNYNYRPGDANKSGTGKE